MARIRGMAVALALGLALLAAALPRQALADPPKIDWQSFIEQLQSTGDDRDSEVGEMMC